MHEFSFSFFVIFFCSSFLLALDLALALAFL